MLYCLNEIRAFNGHDWFNVWKLTCKFYAIVYFLFYIIKMTSYPPTNKIRYHAISGACWSSSENNRTALYQNRIQILFKLCLKKQQNIFLKPYNIMAYIDILTFDRQQRYVTYHILRTEGRIKKQFNIVLFFNHSDTRNLRIY